MIGQEMDLNSPIERQRLCFLQGGVCTSEAVYKAFFPMGSEVNLSELQFMELNIANDFTIGIEREVFSFSHCCKKVTIAETSGLNGDTVQVQDFIPD